MEEKGNLMAHLSLSSPHKYTHKTGRDFWLARDNNNVKSLLFVAADTKGKSKAGEGRNFLYGKWGSRGGGLTPDLLLVLG